MKAQYEPYADVNIEQTVDVVALSNVENADILQHAKQFNSPSLYVAPKYSIDDVTVIEIQTRKQNDNPMWHLLREGWISSSVAHDVLTKTCSLLKGKTDDVTSLIDLVVNGLYIDPNLPALKYGRENEYEAADTYYDNQHTLHSNLKVDVCGMFVDTTHSFLSASPDRLVSCDCCGKGLLEIKCPISIAG